MDTSARTKIKYGVPISVLAISTALCVKAQSQAKAFWNSQAAEGFMEGVDTCTPGHEFSLDWIPHAELANFGYSPVRADHQWVMTTGVETHVDSAFGPTLIWVLVNDGLYFKQGGKRIFHQPGEWYIFNDALAHEVDTAKATPKEAVYLGWALRLKTI